MSNRTARRKSSSSSSSSSSSLSSSPLLRLDTNAIGNKSRRSDVRGRIRTLKSALKKERRQKRRRERDEEEEAEKDNTGKGEEEEKEGKDEENDDDDDDNKNRKKKLKNSKDEDETKPKKEKAKLMPVTLDNSRESDETTVSVDDEEVQADEAIDEFANYFKGAVTPRIVITSNYTPTKAMYTFIRDLLRVFPNSFYYERRRFEIKDIVKQATDKDFTDVIIINEDKKTYSKGKAYQGGFNGLTHIHLPIGPTAHYKLSNVMISSEVPNAGRATNHKPEVILNNFSTRLGHRVGRMLGSLFHQEPNFHGRRVATFHNQRDFIFFRHHRYIFDVRGDTGAAKARLQELGPRFTLKLRWLQHGTFDTQHGELEWKHKSREMDTSRRRFFL